MCDLIKIHSICWLFSVCSTCFSFLLFLFCLVLNYWHYDSILTSLLAYCLFVLVTKLYLTLCDPMNCSRPGSSVLGISQARILEWVAMPSSRGSSLTSDQTQVSCIAGYFSTWTTRKAPGESISYLLSRWPELSFQSLSNLFNWTTNSLRAGIRFLCSMLPCKYVTLQVRHMYWLPIITYLMN